MRAIRAIFLAIIGCGFTLGSVSAQNCDPGADGITPVGGGPQQLANGDVCSNSAVVSATMKILYTNVDDGGNPNLVEFLIDWDDGSMETLTFAGGDITQPAFPPNSYEATVTHFFPPNGGSVQCEYIPITFLQFNGIGTCAGSAASPPAFVRWNTDDQLTGNHLLAEQATNVVTFQVCAGQPATVRFSDQSTFNCVPPAYMNLVNNRTRWTQFIYGTNNTITSATGVLVDGNLEVYPFNGVVQSQTTPVDVPFAVSLDITVPTDAQVGEEFEITMNSWNFCNQNGVDPPIVTTARILIIDSPPTPIAPVADFCVGTNPILTVAGTGGTLTWYSDPGLAPVDVIFVGATINAATDPPVADRLNNAAPGSKTYYVTETLGVNNCEGPATTVVFTMIENPTNANAGADFSVCAATAQLSGNNPAIGAGLWISSGPGTVDNNSQFDSGISGLAAGTTTTFTWTITNGGICQSLDAVSVTRDQLPSTANAGPDISLCVGTNAFMDATIPAVGTGTWVITSPAVTTEIIVDPNDPKTEITGLIAGTTYDLDWEVNNLTCMPPAMLINNDQLQILNFLDPPADAGLDIDQCTASIILDATTPPVGTGLWVITAGFTGVETFVLDTDPKTQIDNLVAGNTYTLSWTVTNGVCISIDFMTLTRSLPPTGSNAGPDQLGCSSSFTLAANTPVSGTGLWSITLGAGTFVDAADPNTIVNNVGLGANTFTWTILSGCGGSSNDVIITNDNSTTSNAGPDQTICGTNATLAANTPASGVGTWIFVSNPDGLGNITNILLPGSGFTGTQGVTYELQWSIDNGACPISNDNVIIQFDLNPTASAAGLDQILCGNSTVLAANNPAIGTGLWSFVSNPDGLGNITNTALFNSAFSGTAGVTYELQWTISNGVCPSSQDNVIIQFDANPTVANAGSDQIVCGGSTTLVGNNPAVGSGLWTFFSNPDGLGNIANIGLFNSNFTGTPGIVYELTWTTSNGICASTNDNVIIQFDQSPTVATAGGDQTLCATSAVMAANTPVIGTGAWSVVVGDGLGSFVLGTDPTTTFNGTAGVTYTLRWTISNGVCTDSQDDVIIQFDANPTVAAAGPGQTLCGTSAALAANLLTIGTGLWTVIVGDGLGSFALNTNPTTTFTGTAGVTYTLRWTTSNGVCAVSQDDVIIQLDANPTIAIAGVDQNICGISTSLAGNNPAIGTGLWTFLSNPDGLGVVGNAAQFNSNISGTAGVAYDLQWTISNSVCPPTMDNVLITFSSALPVTTISGETEACVGDTKTYTIPGGNPVLYNYTWDLTGLPPSSTVIPGSGTPFQFISIQFNDPITNGVLGVVTDDGLCIGPLETFNITVFETPQMSIVSSDVDGIICENESVTFTATDALDIADNFEFQLNGITVQSSPSPIFTTSSLGFVNQVVVIGTTGGICPASSSPPIAHTVNPIPAVFNIQGGGTYCLGGSGATVGLDGSEPLITYELYLDGNPTGTTITPGGGAFNFPSQVAAGIYTIEAVTVPNCALFMAGNTSITIDPLPSLYTANGGGDICSDDPGASITLDNSDLGIDYQLLKDGFPIGITLSGTGASLDFGLQTPAGTYTIEATNVTTLCTVMMLGNRDITILPKPSVLATNNNTSICTGFDTDIRLNSDVIGATFTWTVSVSDASLTGATNQAIPQPIATIIGQTLVNTSSLPQTATYFITSTGPIPTNCIGDIEQVEVIVNPEPVALISGNTTICNGSTASIRFEMSAGELPYDIVYTDGSSNFNLDNVASPHVINVSPAFTTIYSIVFVSDVNGCITNTGSGLATVTVEDAIADFSTNQISSSCNPFPVTFSNNNVLAGVTYEWSWGDGTANEVTTSETSITHEFVNNSTSATLSYSVVLVATNNNVIPACTDISSTIIEVFPAIVVDVIADVDDGCGPLTVNFDNRSLGVTDHKWFYRRQGINEETEVRTTPFVSYVLDNSTTSAITYEVVYSATKGTCSEERITPVSVYPDLKPSFTISPGNTVLIIEPPHVTITNTTPNANSWNYEWDMGDGSTIITDINPAPYTYTTFGTYKIKLLISDPNSPIDCSVSTSEVVIVEPVFPIVDFIMDVTEGCRPLTVNFTNLSQFVDPDTYFWQFTNQNGESIGTSQIENPSFTFFDPGLYTVSLDGSNPLGNAANETKEMIIKVNDIPTVSFSIRPTKVFLPDQPIFTDNSSIGADIFVWDFGDGTIVEEFEPQHVYTEEGLYAISLTATSLDGCENTEIKTDVVTVLQGGTTRIPNAFTPSLDGPSGGVTGSSATGSGTFNDVFLPVTEGVQEFNLQIFDRWGNLMFESKDKTIGWDGYTTNGRLVPQGVYVYKTVMKFINGEKITRVGDVTVIR